ncbi:MAG: ATPase, T2SS/T4P/T4SS family [Candidatus Nezhaarchaeales archaeon]
MMPTSCLTDSCIKTLFRNGKHILIMKCRHEQPDLISNEICRGKMFLKLSLLNKAPKGIMVFSQKDNTIIKYGFSTVRLLSDYSRRLSRLRKLLMNFWIRGELICPLQMTSSRPHSCPLYEEIIACRDHLLFFHAMGIAYTHPFSFFDFLQQAPHKVKEVKCKNKKCIKKLRDILTLFLKEVENSKIIRLLRSYHDRLGDEVYREIFRLYTVSKRALQEITDKRFLVKEYEVDVYRVRIYEFQGTECIYHASLSLPYIAKFFFKTLVDNVNETVLSQTINFDLLWEKTCFLKEKFEELLRTKRIINNDDYLLVQKLASYSTYKILGLHKLMPFLLDRNVDEIYLDKPGTRVYLDHVEVGRCVSNIVLTNEDVKCFINHVLLESKLPLSHLNPSLKWNLRINDYIVRASVDIPPLSCEGPSLDLRKIKHRNYTIIDLIRDNVLSLEEAAFLILHILNRRNIIICGEPGTGKTTLMNALDLCTPRNWRKIYVEDVIESLDQRIQGRHQLKLHVEPFETQRRARRKYVEMIKLLHRTPDWICMGELQSKEHFKAMFHAITAGLRGMHTCHASSIQGLVRRWLLHCDISREDVIGIDLLIHMVKCYRGSKILRRVAEIWAVGSSGRNSIDVLDIPLTLVFKWDPQEDSHKATIDDIFKSPSICRMMEVGSSYEMLMREYEELMKSLSTLMKSGHLNITTFTKTFDEFIERLIAGSTYYVV